MKRNEIRRVNRVRGGNRFWSGLLLLTVGGLLLAKQAGAYIPGWLFHWHMLLIGIGLMISFKSNFKNAGGLIMIIVGVAFLLNDIIPDANMQNFIWPGIFIVAGLLFIFKPRTPKNLSSDWDDWKQKKKDDMQTFTTIPGEEEIGEYIDINSVFGGVKKIILSKNFKGGEINAFMGGAEINLLQADIKGSVHLDVNNVFGGTKLILPSNWDIKNEITAVFGGVEDKRSINLPMPDPSKTIVLTGSCVFGGIEIKNF